MGLFGCCCFDGGGECLHSRPQRADSRLRRIFDFSGQMSFAGALTAGMIGGMAGSVFAYLVGHYGGRTFVDRYGHYFWSKEACRCRTALV